MTRLLPWLVPAAAVVLAVLLLRGTAADHPLATVPAPPLCALLERAPGASNRVRAVDAGSPLAGIDARASACDLLVGADRVGVLLTTRRDLAERGDPRDTDVWLAEAPARLPAGVEAVRGPWRRALLLAPGHGMLVEDNGVLIQIVGAPSREHALDAARRAAEALRAAPPPGAG